MYGLILINLPLHVVWWRPTAQRMLGKNKQHVYTSMLQLQSGGQREPLLSNYRCCSHAREEICRMKAQRTQWGVLFQRHHARSVLRGGSAKQRGAIAAASLIPGSCGRSRHSGKAECPGSYAAAKCKSVSSGSGHVQRSIYSTADYGEFNGAV
jgi:hypothetical protein